MFLAPFVVKILSPSTIYARDVRWQALCGAWLFDGKTFKSRRLFWLKIGFVEWFNYTFRLLKIKLLTWLSTCLYNDFVYLVFHKVYIFEDPTSRNKHLFDSKYCFNLILLIGFSVGIVK